MAGKNAALIAALTDELARANKRAAKQRGMTPKPSGYAHTLRWVELTERKLRAAKSNKPDGWRKPRGAAAQAAAGKRPQGGNPRAKRAPKPVTAPAAPTEAAA